MTFSFINRNTHCNLFDSVPNTRSSCHKYSLVYQMRINHPKIVPNKRSFYIFVRAFFKWCQWSWLDISSVGISGLVISCLWLTQYHLMCYFKNKNKNPEDNLDSSHLMMFDISSLHFTNESSADYLCHFWPTMILEPEMSILVNLKFWSLTLLYVHIRDYSLNIYAQFLIVKDTGLGCRTNVCFQLYTKRRSGPGLAHYLLSLLLSFWVEQPENKNRTLTLHSIHYAGTQVVKCHLNNAWWMT